MKLASVLKRQLTAPFSLQHLPNSHTFSPTLMQSSQASSNPETACPALPRGTENQVSLSVQSRIATTENDIIMSYAWGRNFVEGMGDGVSHLCYVREWGNIHK